MAVGKRPGRRSQSQNDFLEAAAPINVVATDVGTNRAFNDGAASVSFQLPEGSTPADSFSVTATKVGTGVDTTATNTTGTTSPIVVGGLDSNANYTFTVTAINNAGSSVPSAPSNQILITTVPATPVAPTVQAFANDQNDYVTITAPSNNGGKAITQYNWESNDGKSGNRATAGQFPVPQEADTTQAYRVRAVNANGASQFSPFSGNITTPPFFPPFFPFFPPFFPFFPPSFPFFPFFPPMFPFFPFFPPSFPFFPFFPPMFPFFPFFPPFFPFFPPRFPPFFPFFPFFPPRFPPFFPFFPFFPPTFKRRCLAPSTQILTPSGWVEASTLKPGDSVVTIAEKHMNLESLLGTGTSNPLPSTVELVEVRVASVVVKTGVLVGFNNQEKQYSGTQPVFVKTEDKIVYMGASDVQVGDVLLGVDENGDLVETPVESIQRDQTESEVYDIRTSTHPWFLTRSAIVIT